MVGLRATRRLVIEDEVDAAERGQDRLGRELSRHALHEAWDAEDDDMRPRGR